MRAVPFDYYDHYLDHELSDKEKSDLLVRRDWCLSQRKEVIRCCCFAIACSFLSEANYIDAVLAGNAREYREEHDRILASLKLPRKMSSYR